MIGQYCMFAYDVKVWQDTFEKLNCMYLNYECLSTWGVGNPIFCHGNRTVAMPFACRKTSLECVHFCHMMWLIYHSSLIDSNWTLSSSCTEKSTFRSLEINFRIVIFKFLSMTSADSERPKADCIFTMFSRISTYVDIYFSLSTTNVDSFCLSCKMALYFRISFSMYVSI